MCFEALIIIPFSPTHVYVSASHSGNGFYEPLVVAVCYDVELDRLTSSSMQIPLSDHVNISFP